MVTPRKSIDGNGFCRRLLLDCIDKSKDDLHETAMAASQSLGARQIVTSEMVLVEFLNGLSKYGDATRKAAVILIAELRKNPRVEVIPQTSVLFQASVAHYAQRLDQQWGVTDCSSFVIMGEYGITEALTADHHFSQAGFAILMKSH